MVAAVLPYRADNGGRWSFYLLLSLLLNGLIISQITLNSPEAPVFDMPVLQVNLMSLAKPMAVPEPEPVPEPVKTVTPIVPKTVIEKPIVTETVAPEKIQVEANIPMPRQKPALSLPEPQKRIVEKPVLEPEKLPVKEEMHEIQKVQEIAKIEENVEPKPEVIEKTPAAVKSNPDASGSTGRDNSTTINEAKYRHQTPPLYPRRALDLGQQGTVTLHAKVLPSGRPGELKIAKSSGHRLLDRAALSAVKKWKFEPTTVDGIATVSWVRVPVNFVIQ